MQSKMKLHTLDGNVCKGKDMDILIPQGHNTCTKCPDLEVRVLFTEASLRLDLIILEK